LGECQTLLLFVTLQVESPDRWQWRPDPAMGYSVHDAYQILTSQDSVTLGEAEHLLWHRQVLLKVSIFARRLLGAASNKDKPSFSRHSRSRSPRLCDRLRWH
jgi:hypothetical protein